LGLVSEDQADAFPKTDPASDFSAHELSVFPKADLGACFRNFRQKVIGAGPWSEAAGKVSGKAGFLQNLFFGGFWLFSFSQIQGRTG
jgi:hypothetical protein